MNPCNCCGQENCKCNYPDPRILQLEFEVTRLSGKTGFCVQCEQYARERDKFREALEYICYPYRNEELRDVSVHGLLGRAEGIAKQALQEKS